jgi:hypothetical protein
LNQSFERTQTQIKIKLSLHQSIYEATVNLRALRIACLAVSSTRRNQY